MPSVIDQLVIELDLDPKKFVGGQKAISAALKHLVQDASKEGKDLESQAKKADAFFVSFKRNALELTGLLVGGAGMKAFIGNIVQSDAALGRLSARMQIPIKTLSVWEGMVTQVGGAAGDATSSIAAMERELSNLRVGQGSPELTALAARLGVDLKGGAISATNALEAFHAALERNGTLARDPRIAANILNRLPGMNEGMLNLLLQTTAALNEYKAAAIAAGSATDASAKAAQEYQAALANLDRSATGLGRTLLTGVAPILSTMMDIFNGLFSGNIDLFGTKIERLKKADPSTLSEDDRALRDAALKRDEESKARDRARDDRLKSLYGPGDAPIEDAKARLRASFGNAPAGNVVKPGAFSGGESAGVLALAARIARDVPELARFTAGKDAYHSGTGSKHDAGLALDFTIKDAAQSAIVSQSIRNKLTAMGIGGKVLDEYRNPSARSTAPHIHVQFDSPNAAAEYFSRTGVQSGAPAAAAITNITNGGSSSNSSKSNNVNVGPISIYPAGGDAKSVAAGLGGALRQNFAAGLDTSLV